MGYPLRNLDPGQTHHVYSRCINREVMMNSRKMKKMFMVILKKAQEKYKFDLNAFAIMPDHFHFMITTLFKGATLDRIMQYIKSKFAIRYNKVHNRTGPVWNGRYKDKVIEYAKKAARYINNLIVYFGNNPVKAGLAKEPEEYKYSSYNKYMNGKYDLPIEIKIHPLFNFDYVSDMIKAKKGC